MSDLPGIAAAVDDRLRETWATELVERQLEASSQVNAFFFFITNEDPMGKRLVFLLGPGHYATNTNSRSCVPTQLGWLERLGSISHVA